MTDQTPFESSPIFTDDVFPATLARLDAIAQQEAEWNLLGSPHFDAGRVVENMVAYEEGWNNVQSPFFDAHRVARESIRAEEDVAWAEHEEDVAWTEKEEQDFAQFVTRVQNALAFEEREEMDEARTANAVAHAHDAWDMKRASQRHIDEIMHEIADDYFTLRAADIAAEKANVATEAELDALELMAEGTLDVLGASAYVTKQSQTRPHEHEASAMKRRDIERGSSAHQRKMRANVQTRHRAGRSSLSQRAIEVRIRESTNNDGTARQGYFNRAAARQETHAQIQTGLDYFAIPTEELAGIIQVVEQDLAFDFAESGLRSDAQAFIRKQEERRAKEMMRYVSPEAVHEFHTDTYARNIGILGSELDQLKAQFGDDLLEVIVATELGEFRFLDSDSFVNPRGLDTFADETGAYSPVLVRAGIIDALNGLYDTPQAQAAAVIFGIDAVGESMDVFDTAVRYSIDDMVGEGRGDIGIDTRSTFELSEDDEGHIILDDVPSNDTFYARANWASTPRELPADVNEGTLGLKREWDSDINYLFRQD